MSALLSQVSQGYTVDDLVLLSSLRPLQHLHVGSLIRCLEPALSEQLLQALTSLTCLEVYECAVKDLCLLRTCTGLQGLRVGWQWGEMGPAEWASIAQLTQLTWLDLDSMGDTTSPAMTSAYQQLKWLRHVRAAAWPPAVLSSMSAGSQLTAVDGRWVSGLVPEGAVFPKMLQLGRTSGVLPARMFPNLQRVVLSGPIDSSALVGLSEHCPSIQALLVDDVV